MWTKVEFSLILYETVFLFALKSRNELGQTHGPINGRSTRAETKTLMRVEASFINNVVIEPTKNPLPAESGEPESESESQSVGYPHYR